MKRLEVMLATRAATRDGDATLDGARVRASVGEVLDLARAAAGRFDA